MSVPAWKLHDKFSLYWKEYKKQDLYLVCKSLLILMNIKHKGNSIEQVQNHWINVCNFLIQWEGNKNS